MNLEIKFYKTIKLNKPSITESFMKMYLICIKNFYSQNTKYKTIKKMWFLESNKILKLINDKPNRTQVFLFSTIQGSFGNDNL